MSKLVDKIKRASTKTVAPMGFKKASTEAEVPPVLLIANLSGATQKQAKDLVDAGIDAVLMDLNDEEGQDLAKFQKNIGDLPFGFRLSESFENDMDKLIERGCDFVIFGMNVDINIVDKEKIAKVIMVDKSLTPAMIKAIGDLNMDIDCVMPDGEKKNIDMELLLISHLYKDILNKPLLVSLERTPSKSELGELRAAGVRGLILPAKMNVAAVREIQKLISELPRTPKKKAASERPLIPSLSFAAPAQKEEVEQEEEEEDIRKSA
jgi:hypothetical protein